MLIEIRVSKQDSPKMLLRLHNVGIEPEIRQLKDENALFLETEMNLIGLIQGLEALIVPHPSMGYGKIGDL